MKAVPLKRALVQRGDLLCLADNPHERLLFKFFGHDGEVVATWVHKKEGRPDDAILRQRDVRRLTC